MWLSIGMSLHKIDVVVGLHKCCGVEMAAKGGAIPKHIQLLSTFNSVNYINIPINASVTHSPSSACFDKGIYHINIAMRRQLNARIPKRR